jgi:hypothetical protein
MMKTARSKNHVNFFQSVGDSQFNAQRRKEGTLTFYRWSRGSKSTRWEWTRDKQQ